jgi:hypothetical protein
MSLYRIDSLEVDVRESRVRFQSGYVKIIMEVPMNKIMKSDTALKAQTALWETGRSSRVVGWGDPPLVPYAQDGWTLEILNSDAECTMPQEVLRRLKILKENGIKIEHILIAHERAKIEPPRIQIPQKVVHAISNALPTLASIVIGLVTVLATIVSVIVGLFVTIIVAVAMVDPVVIVVLNDEQKTWLEVAKWEE